MTLYLFRHGETYYSKHKIPYGKEAESAGIIPEGVSKIKKIASELNKEGVKIIYSSPLKRCVQTVEIIQKEVPAIKVVYYQGLEEEKVAGGLESLKELTQRIDTFLNEIKDSGLKKVGVCSHGWPLAVMISLLKKGTVNKFDLLNYPECGELITTRNSVV